MRFIARVTVAALAGAVIAWAVTALGLYGMFAAEGYTREALVELPPWVFGVVGGGGALVALTAAVLVSQTPLPDWVRPAMMGGLIGVVGVVVLTLIVANILGGPWGKLQAPYLYAGLLYGVPGGLAGGVVSGLIVAKRRRGKGDPQAS